MVAAIATVAAATMTATQRCNGNATATVMEAYCQRRAGRALSPEQISVMSALVAEQSKAMAVVDYPCADEIFDLLSREYSININDRAGKWALVHKEYAFNPNVSSFVPDKDVLAAIGKRLGKRILAQKRRDFDVADNIRNELCDKYVVEIDDRNKEWMVVVPRGGRWLKDNDGEGDENNIVSREEWEEGEDEDGGSPSPRQEGLHSNTNQNTNHR